MNSEFSLKYRFDDETVVGCDIFYRDAIIASAFKDDNLLRLDIFLPINSKCWIVPLLDFQRVLAFARETLKSNKCIPNE